MNIPIFAGIFFLLLVNVTFNFQEVRIPANFIRISYWSILWSDYLLPHLECEESFATFDPGQKMWANLATPFTEASQGQLSFADLHRASESMNSITRYRNCFKLYFVWPQQHSEKAKSNFLFCGQAVEIYKYLYISSC